MNIISLLKPSLVRWNILQIHTFNTNGYIQVRSCHNVAQSCGATLWQRCFWRNMIGKKGVAHSYPNKTLFELSRTVFCSNNVTIVWKLIHTCTSSIRIFYLKDAPIAYWPRWFHCLQTFFFREQDCVFEVQPYSTFLGLLLSVDNIPLRFDCRNSTWVMLSFKVYHDTVLLLEDFCGTCTMDPQDAASI